ncbi:MAG TPA: FtsX-like permease family protein, partial [Pyrinomonadaceae bacterium]
SVTLNGVPLQVVGVLSSTGSSTTSNNDDTAVVPYSTATQRLLGGTTRTSVGTIYVEATSSKTLSAAYQETQSELLAMHHITTPTGADFTITTQQSLLTTANSVNKTLTVLLGGIAAISLLVGGIGVMNIMLVSVTERTKEIGIRKAIGARRRDIVTQFLFEAMTLTFMGGILGVVLAVSISKLIMLLFPSLPAQIPLWAVISGLTVSVGVGLVFGVWPARKASRLDPIECLRYE